MADDTPPAAGTRAERLTWRDLHLWEIQPIRDVLLVLAVVGLFMLGDAISIVTVPLLLAVLLAYLFEPVIRWVESRTSLRRRPIVSLTIVAFVVFVVVPSVIGLIFGVAQVAALLTTLSARIELLYQCVQSPEDEALAARLAAEAGPAWTWICERLVETQQSGEVESTLGVIGERLRESAALVIGTTATAGVSAVRSALALVGGAFALAFSVFLTGFFFFFVSTGWLRVRAFADSLLPEAHRERIIDLAAKFDAVISGFVRGRLTIAFVQGVFFSLAYWAVGVPAAFIIGPAVAILSIVPYLALVGIPVSVALLWLESHAGFRGQWWWVLGAPSVVYFLGQTLDDYVFTPLIQGKSTNMDTPTILFASLAGGALFGVFGLLVAIPIAACVKIIMVELVWPRFRQWAEGRARDPLPFEGAENEGA